MTLRYAFIPCLVLTLGGASVACGTDDEDIGGDESAIVSKEAVYADVEAAGGKIFVNDGKGSAKLKAFIPNMSLEDVVESSTNPNRWRDGLTDPMGRPIDMTDVNVTGAPDAARKATWKLHVVPPAVGELGAVDADMSLDVHREGAGIVITSTNAQKVKKGPFTVIEPNGLQSKHTLIPYNGGVLIVGESRMQLKHFQSLARDGGETINVFFDWVKADVAKAKK